MTISRHQFRAALGAAGLSAAALPAFDDDKKSPPLRVIAYNVYACKGWPDDRPLAKKGVERGRMTLGGTNLPFGDELQDRFPIVGWFLDEQGQANSSGLSPDHVLKTLEGVYS